MGLVIGPRLSAAGGVAIAGIDLAEPLPPEPKGGFSRRFTITTWSCFPVRR